MKKLVLFELVLLYFYSFAFSYTIHSWCMFVEFEKRKLKIDYDFTPEGVICIKNGV